MTLGDLYKPLLKTAILGGLLLSCTSGMGITVTNLRCEYGTNPLGIDSDRPRLSWQMEDAAPETTQSAYQILVSDSLEALHADRGNLWDSDKVISESSIQVSYQGEPMESSAQAFWKVRVWNQDDQPTEWSAPASWTMGVMGLEDWKAEWIRAPDEYPSQLFRKPFTVKKDLERAIIHVCGLGHYELFLNGKKCGNEVLSPGWTHYDKTTLYETRDITQLLITGENVAGLVLGNGMYHVRREGRFSKFERSYGDKRAIVEIRLEYRNGTVDIVKSDDSWKTLSGPITYSNIYGGEDHDARLEPGGWSESGFSDDAWLQAVVDNSLPKSTLKGYTFSADPIIPIETRNPVEIRELDGPGAYLYDFGQNASYMPRLTVSGPAGSLVRLIPGENIYPDGYISRASMGGIHRNSSWWEYIKCTDEPETWFPKFFYIGSRYIQSQAIAAERGGELPVVETLEGVIVHSAARPIGEFETSNALLNKIRDLVRWAQRSNMVSVLTDCPHREKLGWLEQYHLNGPSIRYEFDMTRIFTKGMLDMADAQEENGMVPNIAPEYTKFRGPFRSTAEWGAAFIAVPWQQYLFSGDIELIRQYFPQMKQYLSYLESTADNYLLHEGLGDWFDLGPRRPPGRAQLTLPPLTTTAFFFNDAVQLSRMAELIGEQGDADYYQDLANKIRIQFNNSFYNETEGYYGNNSQCANALALVMELVDAENRDRVLRNLLEDVIERGYAMTAGDIGFRYLLLALSDGGHDEAIYRMINQDDKPGYGYQLRMGATALTEAWDGNKVTSNNHFMLGHITEWFYGRLLGIRPDPEQPGFKHIILDPRPVGDLEWIKGGYESLYGEISVAWSQKNGEFSYSVVIPPNTSASLRLPGSESVMELQSGSYEFETQLEEGPLE